MVPGVAFLLLLGAFLLPVLLCARPLGLYIARVVDGRLTATVRPLGRLEAGIYRLCGVNADVEMTWSQYATALLVFNVLGALALYLLQRAQGRLPANPAGFGAVGPDSAFNTAISFVTNTDWQGYSGESTLGYLVQMTGLTVQNFLSAATGIAVAIALVRGLARHSAATIGNFWVDTTRVTLYVLLPLAVLFAVLLSAQGVIQNLDGYRVATTLEETHYAQPVTDAEGAPVVDTEGQPVTRPAVTREQTLPMGPVASQEAIKEVGTNGGGFFGANSAHPYENPTPLTNLLELIAIFLIPLALTYTFGQLIGDRRQGWALLAAMLLMFLVLAAVGYHAEISGNPRLAALGVDQSGSGGMPVGNLEGKELRFGAAASALFAAVTTATSTGAVNAAHDSLMPLGGFVPLFLMQLGELAPGGVGTGLYSILMFAILGVFIAGLMIGRTPEYVGKKIEAVEMKLAAIFILTTPCVVLIGTAVAVSCEAGRAGVGNPGPHGFTEILYAFTSAANNNGSAFGGLSAGTVFYNVSTAIAMFVARYWPIVAVLALAGSLASKKRIPVSEGTMPTHGPLFVALLIGSVLLIGVLTYVPALVLGPIVEHFLLNQVR